ncbi:MAG: hypothetical protein F9K36_15200 [Burkholderiaceae bacterium]|nr:MAG: hypothetical protein F9K36_15200 [Burkholderiaceae bacterium]
MPPRCGWRRGSMCWGCSSPGGCRRGESSRGSEGSRQLGGPLTIDNRRIRHGEVPDHLRGRSHNGCHRKWR